MSLSGSPAIIGSITSTRDYDDDKFTDERRTFRGVTIVRKLEILRQKFLVVHHKSHMA
jgi:hypothetical protein